MQEQTVETKKIFASLLSRWNQWKFHGADDENLSKIEIQFFQHLLQVFITVTIICNLQSGSHDFQFYDLIFVFSDLDTSPS